MRDLSQTGVAPYERTLGTLSGYGFWFRFEVRPTQETAVLSVEVERSSSLRHTVCRVHSETNMHEGQGSHLSKRKRDLSPRVVLKANSHSGSQDLFVQEARSSWESQEDEESYGETKSDTADYRILGISILTMKLKDARRQIRSQNGSRCSKKHPYKEQFFKDMSQKQEINRFSKESQQLLEDMNQTEIFELGENSAKYQRPDCNVFFKSRDDLSQLWMKFEVQVEFYNNLEDQLRLHFSSLLCH